MEGQLCRLHQVHLAKFFNKSKLYMTSILQILLQVSKLKSRKVWLCHVRLLSRTLQTMQRMSRILKCQQYQLRCKNNPKKISRVSVPVYRIWWMKIKAIKFLKMIFRVSLTLLQINNRSLCKVKKEFRPYPILYLLVRDHQVRN